jgi:hypothetical protein
MWLTAKKLARWMSRIRFYVDGCSFIARQLGAIAWANQLVLAVAQVAEVKATVPELLHHWIEGRLRPVDNHLVALSGVHRFPGAFARRLLVHLCVLSLRATFRR